MAYATQTNLESTFGVQNVAKWSNLDNHAVETDTSRVSDSLAFADAHINARFRGGLYAVPLSGAETTTLVREWAVKIAGWWLQRPRGTTDEMQAHYDDAQEQINSVLNGVLSLDAPHADVQPTAPVIVGQGVNHGA